MKQCPLSITRVVIVLLMAVMFLVPALPVHAQDYCARLRVLCERYGAGRLLNLVAGFDCNAVENGTINQSECRSICQSLNSLPPVPVLGRVSCSGSFQGVTDIFSDAEPVTLPEAKNIIETIANFLLVVSAIVAVIAVVWAGILYMAPGDSEKRAENGKKALKNGLIGAAIILGVGVIFETIASVVTRDFFG